MKNIFSNKPAIFQQASRSDDEQEKSLFYLLYNTSKSCISYNPLSKKDLQILKPKIMALKHILYPQSGAGHQFLTMRSIVYELKNAGQLNPTGLSINIWSRFVEDAAFFIKLFVDAKIEHARLAVIVSTKTCMNDCCILFGRGRSPILSTKCLQEKVFDSGM